MATGTRRMTGGKSSTRGTPQGGVVSPLLANLYMNRFLKHWRLTGRGEAFRAHIVTYADDFVILSRGHAAEALAWTRQVMTRLGLTLNEAKTSVKDARTGALRLPWLHVRAAPLSEGWPLVSGREPVEEERAAAQGEGRRASGARQHGTVARGARPAEQTAARLVGVLQLRHAADGLPGGRQPRLRPRAPLPASGVTRCQRAAPAASPMSVVFGDLGVLRLTPRASWTARRGPASEASRKAGCGKSARPV